jgi:hypothetical protein
VTRRLGRLVALVAAFGLVAQVLTLLLVRHAEPIAPLSAYGGMGWAHGWALVGLCLGLTFAGDWVAVRVRHGEETEELTLFEAACVVDVLVLPGAWALVVPVAATVLCSTVRRRGLVKVVFNGGNLAAAVALRARVEGPALAAQVLVYPVVSPACSSPSMVENATGYLLTTDSMRAMWSWYLGPDGDEHDAFAAIDRAADYTDLPPALVITAEYDPLRDEGEHYAALLDGFDVDVIMTRYDGMIHGFFGLRELVPDSDRAVAQVAEFLRTHLARPTPRLSR